MGELLNYFAMAPIDNIISLLGNDVKCNIRHIDPDLFVEWFVTGIFLEKAFDIHKVNILRSLQIYNLQIP